MITLSRAYIPFDGATLGILRVEGHEFATLEPPWRSNRVGESCMPEGVYTLRKRHSEVVKRSTGGEYSIGWEICDVPGRTYLMVHPGNFASDTEGCPLPGRSFAWIPDEGFMVNDSRNAFRQLMGILDSRGEWTIDIRVNQPEWP